MTVLEFYGREEGVENQTLYRICLNRFRVPRLEYQRGDEWHDFGVPRGGITDRLLELIVERQKIIELQRNK